MSDKIRAAVPRDIDTIYELVASQQTVDYGAPSQNREKFEASWTQRDLEETTLLLSDRDGQILAYVEWDMPPVEEAFFLFYFRLTEESNSAIVDLIHTLENKTRQQGIQTIIGRITGNHPTMMERFTEQAYINHLTFLIMQIQMQAQPAVPEWAEGITVRPFQLNQDEQATYLVDEGASQDKGYYTALDYEQWAKRMNLNGEGFDPSLWFLACAGNEIVGVALNYYSAKTKEGWIDHLGVSRHWRKKGIGMALLRHSFAAFYERGISTVKLSVDSESKTNAHQLYESAGMSVVNRFHYFKKNL